MKTALVKYDAARKALVEASSFDEVKEIRDKAEAMAAYGRMARDTEMIEMATEIRVRAERRAGEMLAELPKSQGGLKSGVSPRYPRGTTGDLEARFLPAPPTLDEIGITKKESSRWQKLAAVSEEQFESAVSAAKEVAGEVTTAALLRATKSEPSKPKPTKPDVPPSDELTALRIETENLKEWGDTNAQNAKELLAENEAMLKVFEADDKLKAALGELKTLRERYRILEERNRSLLGEKNEAIRAAKMWKAKFEKAIKQ